MNFAKNIVIFFFSMSLLSCLAFSKQEYEKSSSNNKAKTIYKPNQETEVAYFASGCFWCVEAVFESVIGVDEAISGYAGGHTLNPTYQTIGTGKTGHAETVAVYYNPKKVSFKT